MAEAKRNIVMTIISSVDTPLGKVELIADLEAVRVVDYLRFAAVFEAPKGHKPAAIYQTTTSDYNKLAPAIAAIPSDQLGMMLKFQLPELMVASKDNVDAIKASYKLIDGMVKLREDSKPKVTSERKIEDYQIRMVADLFLVSAGKTGKIPESLDLSTIFSKAREAAVKKAAELGKDKINQFRLTKEKTVKAEDKKDEKGVTTDPTEDELDELEAENETSEANS